MSRRALVLRCLLICLSALLLTALCPFFGITQFSLAALAQNSDMRHIFLVIRVPRTLAALVAGGGLGIAGMVYQALFRNPLADPYTLGVSGGASLAAALCISLGIGGSYAGLSALTLASFAGAVCAMLIVYSFAWTRGGNATTLLLAGVVVATLCSGLVMFVYYLSDIQHSFQIMRWIMGGVDGVTYRLFAVMSIPVVLYLAYVGAFLPQLDQFLTGDSLAHSRGINVQASRNAFIVTTALAVGAIVSVCGPIGFVGIMAPHACRMLLPGARHRLLGIATFCVGGAFLTASDMLARTITPPAEIPVGILTALFGGPFFLVILFKRKGRLYL